MDDEVDWDQAPGGARSSEFVPKARGKEVRPRTQKTALQKEVLEASYTINQFPTEEHRRALGERIGLTEPQVQVWFTNRRRKDKKQDTVVQQEVAVDDDSDVPLAVTQHARGGGRRPQKKARTTPSKEASAWAQDIARQTMGSPPGAPLSAGAAPPASAAHANGDRPRGRKGHTAHTEDDGAYHDAYPAAQLVSPKPRAAPASRSAPTSRSLPPVPPPQPAQEDSDAETEEDPGAMMVARRTELEELLLYARRTLPVPYREDGPPLGIDFDEIPVDQAADVPIKPARGPGSRGGKRASTMPLDSGRSKQARPSPPDLEEPGLEYPSQADDGDGGPVRESKRQSVLEKKLETTMKKEQDRIRKELLKQNERLERERRREEEEYMRERERLEREKRKQVEKMEKERAKEEVRRAREQERLEIARLKERRRLEVKMQKERRAEEKRKEAEARRRDKEMQRALAQQEKSIIRLRQRETQVGPPDDLDLEWEKLMDLAHQDGYTSDTGAGPTARPDPVRPEFPPPELNLQPAFPPELGEESGNDLLVVWNFLHSFSEVLGLTCPSIDELLDAIVIGQQSALLADVHLGLLRVLQADMEEAHATGATQNGAGSNFVDRALYNNAAMLDEAHAWGFDVDQWRAHLNVLTWPEVLREMAIAAGWSERRCKAKRDSKGTEGEDIIADEAGGLKLRMPSRFGVGTVKGAAWQVLAEDGLKHGPRGLKIEEIARIIQQEGLRDLTTSKTPEATVAGGLSRDIIFCRVAPATYALQAVVSYHRRLKEKAERAKENNQKDSEGRATKEEQPDIQVVKQESDPHSDHHSEHDQDDSDSEDEDNESGEESRVETWVGELLRVEYNELRLRDRVAALSRLCHVCSNSTSIRSRLEHRSEEAAKVKKQLWEEAKAERRMRQEEAANKARVALEEAVKYEENQGNPLFMAEYHARQAKQEAEEAAQAEQDRERRAARAERLRMVEEEFSIRVEPLGLDRRHNRYWRFCNGGPNTDKRAGGRLWVESHVDGTWRVLTQPQQLEMLKGALEPKGAREGPLSGALVRTTPGLNQCFPGAPLKLPNLYDSSLRHQVHHRLVAALDSVVSRAEALLDGEHDYIKDIQVPPQDGPLMAKVKRDLLRMEVRVSAAPDAIDRPDFNWSGEGGLRLTWMDRVQLAEGPAQLKRFLGELEMNISDKYLSPKYARLPVLVKGAWLPIGKEVAMVAADGRSLPLAENAADEAEGGNHPLDWLPSTLPALALRLQALDAAIKYPVLQADGMTVQAGMCGRDQLVQYQYILRPATSRRRPHNPQPQPAAQHPGGCRTVLGAPLNPMGHVKPTALPAFPVAVLHAGMQPFKPDIDRLRQAVEQAAKESSQMGRAGAGGEGAGNGARGRGRPPGSRNVTSSRNSSDRSRTPKARSGQQPGGRGGMHIHTGQHTLNQHSPAPDEDEDYPAGAYNGNSAGGYYHSEQGRGRLAQTGYIGSEAGSDAPADSPEDDAGDRGLDHSNASDTQDEELQDQLSDDDTDGLASPGYTTGKRRYTATHTDDSD